MKRKSGYEDQNGIEICEGDIFKWALKEGWRNPHPIDDPFIKAFDLAFNLEPNVISEDCDFISIVKVEDGIFILHTIDDDIDNLKADLHTEEISRNEFGVVVGNVNDNPEEIKWGQEQTFI